MCANVMRLISLRRLCNSKHHVLHKGLVEVNRIENQQKVQNKGQKIKKRETIGKNNQAWIIMGCKNIIKNRE